MKADCRRPARTAATLPSAAQNRVRWWPDAFEGAGQAGMIIDHDSYPGVLVLRPQGRATAAVVRTWLAELDDVPAYHADRDVIFDLSEADLSRLSREELQRIIAGLRDRGDSGPRRVVYVASGELAFGIVRMFATRAGMRVPRDRGVFRSIPEALAWLEDAGSK